LTAPISMMPEAAGPSPVVSRSTATNDTSVRDRARASWTRARQCPSAKRKRGSAPSSVARKRAPNSGSRPCAVKTRSSSSSGAEVTEGHGVLAGATEAGDRDLPLVGIGEGQAGVVVRGGRRGGSGRRRRRGGSGSRRLRLRRRLRGRRPGGALLLEARGRVVGDRLVGMERAGALEQHRLA